MEVPVRTGWTVRKKHIETNFHSVGCWNIPIHTSIYSIWLKSICSLLIHLFHIAEVKTMRPGDGTTFPKEGDQLVMCLAAIQWDHQGWRFYSVKGGGFMLEIQHIRLVGSCIPQRYWLNFTLYFLLWKAELGIPWVVQSIFWRHSSGMIIHDPIIINTNPTLISHVWENPVYFVYFPITIPKYHHQFPIPSHSQMFCLVRGTSRAPCWKKVGSHRPSTPAGPGRSLSASGGRFGFEYLAVEKPIRWWFSYIKSPVRGFFGCHVWLPESNLKYLIFLFGGWSILQEG